MRRIQDPTTPPPSLPEDASAPLPSASIIVLRPAGQAGFEVLLMERAANSRNFAGAMVFPGGKVEVGDAEIALQHGFAPLWEQRASLLGAGHERQTIASLYGAALRETLEEVGLWWPSPDGGGDPAALAVLRQQLLEGAAWHRVQAAQQVAMSVAGLTMFSRWITPVAPNLSRKRFDTWFFVACLPEGQQASADGDEAQRLVWATPRALLASCQRREIILAPPQIMTLAHLARFADIDALDAYARQQAPYCVAPVSVGDAGNRMVCFPGDPLHGQAQRVMPGPTRLVMQGGMFAPTDDFDALYA